MSADSEIVSVLLSICPSVCLSVHLAFRLLINRILPVDIILGMPHLLTETQNFFEFQAAILDTV